MNFKEFKLNYSEMMKRTIDEGEKHFDVCLNSLDLTENAFVTYLTTLSDDELKVIKTVMYIGEEGYNESEGPIDKIFEMQYGTIHRANEGRFVDLGIMVEKKNLVEYLKNGLVILGIY